MKNKIHNDVFRIGSKNVDYEKLEHYEAISIAIVGVLSVTAGIIYGNLLLA